MNEIDQKIIKFESKKELLEKEKEKQRQKEKEEKEKQRQARQTTNYTRRALPYQYNSNTKNNDKNQRSNIETKYNPRKINYNDSKYDYNRKNNNNDSITNSNRKYHKRDTNYNLIINKKNDNTNDTKYTPKTNLNKNDNPTDIKDTPKSNINENDKEDINEPKNNENKNKDNKSSAEKGNVDTNKNEDEIKKSLSPDINIDYKKEYSTTVNNLQTNTFNYQEEKLGENYLEITKKDKNIISYIDIDLFLQRIAQEKKIYEDMNDNDTLLKGFCIQHPIFIPTNTLLSKIISCFNYFYSRNTNQDNQNQNNIETKRSYRNTVAYRSKYRQNNPVNAAKTDQFDDLIFVQNDKKIPYNLIDLLIVFIDTNEKYSKEILTKEVTDKIESFYKSILDMNDIKTTYKKDIESSQKLLKNIKANAILKRAKTHWTKLEFETIFNLESLLSTKIRDPNENISFFNILSYDSTDIAKELTRITYNIFSKIQPKEFFKGVFTKKNKNETSPNITEVANRFNKLSFWIIEEILSYDHANDRAKIIEKMIDIGNELIKLNNFTDCMSVTSALGQVIIKSLAKTWKKISKKTNSILENLKKILNFQDNYKNIRDKIDECLNKNEPYIPFLGPYNKRICFLEEYGPYVKDNSLINVDKIVLVQQILDQFYKCKLKQYDIVRRTKNEFIIFQCLDPLSEEELEKLGSSLEPTFNLRDKKLNQKRPTNTENNFKENYSKKDDII